MVCCDWLQMGLLGRGVRVMHRAATSSVTKYTYPFGYGWLCTVALTVRYRASYTNSIG